jgi:hypothetical protein
LKRHTINYDKIINFIWHILPFIGLVVWGTFCITDNLWYDEAYSASMVSQSWSRLLYITATDDHSPFYYILLKAFYTLFRNLGNGYNFWSLKLLAVLFMVGYLLLGKYYVKKLFDKEISVYFMLFSILLPIMSVQAGNVRMYAAALFFLTLTGLSAYDLYISDTKDCDKDKAILRKKWCIFCIASICTVYCHTFAMIQTFIFYVVFVIILTVSKRYDTLKKLLKCGVVVAVVFSPWLAVTCRQMILRMRYDSGSTDEMAGISSLWDYCVEWFSAIETPIWGVAAAGLTICIILCIMGVLYVKEEKNYAPAAGMCTLFTTVLAGWLISVFINNCFMGRYAFPGFGFLMLIYACGMKKIRNKAAKAVILIAAFVCFVMQYHSELALEYDTGLEVYQQFWADEVTENDAFIGPYTHTIFLNVYHPDVRYYIMGYKLYSLPFSNTDALTDYSQLDDVTGNIWYVTFEGDTPANMADYFDYEEEISFHYMYYDFVIFRLEKRSNTV